MIIKYRRLCTERPLHELLQATISEEDAAFEYARSLNSFGTFAPVLHASIHLGLFNIIARAGPAAELSALKLLLNSPPRTQIHLFISTACCDSLLATLFSPALRDPLSIGKEEDEKVERGSVDLLPRRKPLFR
ncbi:hypothetical protein SLEP1_g56721 [Rubroshorea leprosula]|uniref:Uncharacterized protein n=1 Tax=Rubroshorea leprosula TaxID=152421 RepID=A0AAV5MJ56_9ROSI|nr:hypothetical protein SLEP1_g56721 [Rubroshorea leprosula]